MGISTYYYLLFSERPNRAGSAEPLAIFGRAGSAEPSVNSAEPRQASFWRKIVILTKILHFFWFDITFYFEISVPVLNETVQKLYEHMQIKREK